MNTTRAKVLLSILHRREIAGLLPELAGVLSLDSQNGRVVALTTEQAEAILQAIRSDRRPTRGIVQRGLEDACLLIQNSLDNSQGLGAIPVGQRLYQFKITLLNHSPAIWRRIQVKSCTLDRLHEHLQTAMGWTNSHLHQFHIDGERWGDPELLDDGFDDNDPFYDSVSVQLDSVLPKSGERFTFRYEYDFGDCWMHEVVFEGCLMSEKGKRYPVCVEGEDACPPEDIGGVSGYARYLKAIAGPDQEDHRDLLAWRGAFDPKKFDAVKTTKSMRRGIFDWRNEA